MGRLQGKTAIITGGGSGLGAAISLAYAAEGANVVVTDVNESAAQSIADQIGAQAIALAQDVADETRWEEVFAETQQTFGQPHILVNNAGFNRSASIEECTLEEFRAHSTVMLDAVFLGCKVAVKYMKHSAEPCSIINMSSIAALSGIPFLPAYSAAKGGVRSLSKSIALDFKEKSYPIRCNSVHPSMIDTPILKARRPGDGVPEGGMIEIGDVGHPNDVSALCIYLASDESRFMTAGEYPVENGELHSYGLSARVVMQRAQAKNS